MQAAALSGKAMAEWIAASRGRQPSDVADLALGLTTPLKPAAGEDIGQFPGSGGSSQGAAAPQRQERRQPSMPQQQREGRQQGDKQQQQQRQQPQRQPLSRPAPAGAAAKQRSTEAAAPQVLSRPVRRGA